jgi:hypothetical protein
MREHWSEEKTKDLKNLMNTGLSARQIADKMDISKNSVVGKIHRLRIKWGMAPTTTRKNNMMRTYKGPVIGKRKCNLCPKEFNMHSRFDRFCDSCRRRLPYGM